LFYISKNQDGLNTQPKIKLYLIKKYKVEDRFVKNKK